jgi:hypothetical protein
MSVFGDLGKEPAFGMTFARALIALWSDGVRPTLERYVG